MLLPGLALYLLFERSRRDASEALLAALALSPVILTASAMLGLVSGRADSAGVLLIVITALSMFTACLWKSGPLSLPPRREVWAFLLLVCAALVLVAALPLTREWWRVRSDAWFHGAVVMQIRDFGAPPEDPYFAGIKLQYMWAYHAMVLTLGDMLGLDYFWIMAFVNAHALVLLAVAAYRLAAVFRTETAPRIIAVATTLFAFNAAFWLFLPIKAAKALLGDVRGTEELSRVFTLSPLNYQTAYAFMDIYRNPEFFLDKFMVATAFGIALSLMVASLAAACSFVSTSRRSALVILAGSVAGALFFHTYVGLIVVAALLGASGALFLFRSTVNGYDRRFAVLPALTVAVGVALSAPFLYEVTRGTDSGGASLLNLSVDRAASIVIPCALVLVLAWRERRVRSDASPPTRFLVFSMLVTLVACLLVRLPGANDVDKPAFPVFLTLSVVAGFAVADSCASRSGSRRLAVAAFWLVLFALPCNTIALVGCYATPDGVQVTREELRLARWVRENTSRRAVFIDDQDRVPLVVAGPRRYLFGSLHYASQWRYSRTDMARREHAVHALFGEAPLDSTTLGVLTDVDDPVYIVTRSGRAATTAPLYERSDLFRIVFDDGAIQVRQLDRNGCRAALPFATAAPTDEELIRASRLY